MPMPIYFDSAATRPISKRALDKFIEISNKYPYNPSSVYSAGRDAKKEIERCRDKISSLLSVDAKNIYFTSGATESISIVFSSLLWQKRPGRAIVSAIEHDAVKSFIPLLKDKGWDVVKLRAKEGFVDPEDLKNEINEETKFVSVMALNNVNGAIEDIKALVGISRDAEKNMKHKILFFSDSVQALGKSDLNLKESDVDAASFSAHKIAGPRGIGLLYLKNRDLVRPLSSAGGQEMGLRGGTENVAAISAFAEALTECFENRKEKEERVKEISDYIKSEAVSLGFSINSVKNTTPYIINISTHLPSEVLTRMLSDKGIFISSGSACSNNAKKGENVIETMGFGSKRAMGSVRISLSDENTISDAYELIKALKEAAIG